MKLKSMFGAALVAMMMASCSTPKEITYFQDVYPGSEFTVKPVSKITLKPHDKIMIFVSTQDERLTQQFNLMGSGSNMSTISNGGGSEGEGGLGYTITSDGYITFPMLGKLHIAGMTREEVAEMIEKELQARNLVKEPVVTVMYQNLGVSVLGEVKSPGFYPITNDKFTVLDAIAKSGDLTINGIRTNIKVLRGEPGRQKVYEIDLTDANDVYNSPVYYLQQDDVIYVEPNDKAKRLSTENGNTALTYSFWMSLITFAMSVAVLITK